MAEQRTQENCALLQHPLDDYNPRMPRPNFLIIGAQKAGTSWLARHLRSHPQVFLPDGEIHYFDKDYNFSRGITWYEEHFSSAGDRPAVGEKTPDYLWAHGSGVEGHLPDVHKNIFETLPRARLIAVLRNPVERAISAARHILRSGRIPPFYSLDDLLVGDRRQLLERHGVIDYGRYARQIEAYRQYFDPAQMLILIFEEDVIEKPKRGLEKACEFLGIDPDFEFTRSRKKVNAHRGSLAGLALNHYVPLLRPLWRLLDRLLPAADFTPSPETIRRLHEIYAPENERLYRLLGRRVRSWESASLDLAGEGKAPAAPLTGS
jgi:hypothetical protein